MSKLIDNIKRLAALIKGEIKSGGNTAARVGGLFEDIAAELENKYDKTEADRLITQHDTAENSHLNVQEMLLQKINDVRETLLAADQNITQDLTTHAGTKAIHKTSEEIRAEIVDEDIPETLARVAYVEREKAAILELARQYVTQGIAEVVGGAPDALNALNELAAAINNDPNFAASIMTQLNGKADSTHDHNAIYAPIKPFEGGVYKTQHVYENITIDDAFLDLLEVQSDNVIINGTVTNSDLFIWEGNWLFRKENMNSIMAWNGMIELNWGYLFKRDSNTKHWNYSKDIGVLSISDLNTKADKNHNHDNVYQPKGNYATIDHSHVDYAALIHDHNASQITDTDTKVMMTTSERSKLSGIEAGANKYIHPNDSNNRHVTDAEKAKLAKDYLLLDDAANQFVPSGINSNTIVSAAPITFVKVNASVKTRIDTSNLQGGQMFIILIKPNGELENELYSEYAGLSLKNNIGNTDLIVLAVWDAQTKFLRCIFYLESNTYQLLSK